MIRQVKGIPEHHARARDGARVSAKGYGHWLRELRRVLAPDGRLLFSTHHPAHEALRLAADGFDVRYDEVQFVEEEWTDIGCVRFYRRSLSRITDALADAGFVIERIVEPLPTDAFREVKPEAYAILLQRPEFLIVHARSASPNG